MPAAADCPCVPHAFLPARFTAAGDTPWVPSDTSGKASRPLRFLTRDRGFVELLRMQPGTMMPLHRHTGEIHAFNLHGSRQLCTGERIDAGDYVYKPAGQTDWWKVVGDEPLLALVVVMGEVEFLNADGTVRARACAATQRAAYERHCHARGLRVADLMETA